MGSFYDSLVNNSPIFDQPPWIRAPVLACTPQLIWCPCQMIHLGNKIFPEIEGNTQTRKPRESNKFDGLRESNVAGISHTYGRLTASINFYKYDSPLPCYVFLQFSVKKHRMSFSDWHTPIGSKNVVSSNPRPTENWGFPKPPLREDHPCSVGETGITRA